MKKTVYETYKDDVVPALMKELQFKNQMQVPKLAKIVINIGLGEANQNAKALEVGQSVIETITGQKCIITRARKSVAGFKIREGMPIGVKVTLRGQRMYDFWSKMVNIVIPRIRDFRGYSDKGFDGRGNYNIGLKDQLVFPELNYDMIDRLRGMNISIVTTASDDVEAKALLTALGFPFKRPKKSKDVA